MSTIAVKPAPIFQHLSAELRNCEAIGLRVEAAVAELVAVRGEMPRTDLTVSLQELDLLVQTLRDVAAFTGALGAKSRLDQAGVSEALAVLKLERVRATLSGRADSQAEVEHETMF